MDMREIKQKSWFKTAITTAIAGITLVASVVGLWVVVQNSIKDSITESMSTITLEVRRSALDIVEILGDDLNTRKRVLDREIEALERQGAFEPERQIVLERKRSNRDDIEKIIREIERKWSTDF